MVLLLLGKLAGVRMPVWKKDSLTAVASPLKWGRAMGVLEWGRECSAVRRPMQRTALAIEARCIRHRSALHPSIHARASEAPTPSLSSLTLLRKFGKQIMHFFPQRKTGRCFAATPCHSLGTSLCLRRKIVFRISVAKIQQPFAFCKF